MVAGVAAVLCAGLVGGAMGQKKNAYKRVKTAEIVFQRPESFARSGAGQGRLMH